MFKHCSVSFQAFKDVFRCSSYNGGNNCCIRNCNLKDQCWFLNVGCALDIECHDGLICNATNATCIDIDECVVSDPCPNVDNASCKNIPYSYDCVCDNGYTGKEFCAVLVIGLDYKYPIFLTGNAWEFCHDIDECQDYQVWSQTCLAHSQCVNVPGSFNCSCYSGYEGDPYVGCTDIDECVGGNGVGNDCPVVNGTCQNYDGGYWCECPSGMMSFLVMSDHVLC